MAVVGLFYGSDTGNTENIAKMIQKQLGNELVDIRDIAKSSKEDIEGYDFLLFGIPTWYYGEAQADWDDFFPTLEEIDFTDKLVGVAIRKTTQITSVMRSVQYVISLNHVARLSWAIGQLMVTPLKHQKHY